MDNPQSLEAVSNGQSPVAQLESNSVEYLLDRQCRIEGDPVACPVPREKDAEERGEGSDSGVEFGAGSLGNNNNAAAHLQRLSSEEVELDARSVTETRTTNLDLEDLRNPSTTTDSPSATITIDDGRDNEELALLHANGQLQRHEVFAQTEGQFSCDSSMLSFCSEENLLDGGGSSNKQRLGREVRGGDCASEGGGSESSSVYNQPVMVSSGGGGGLGSVKKRVSLMESGGGIMGRNMSASTTQLSKPETLGKAKFRATSVNRVGPPSLLTKDRARSKDRGHLGASNSPLLRTNSLRRPPKPDSLPVSSPMAPPTKRMSTLGRTQSVRTPGSTPTDSGRWPYGPQTGSMSASSTPRSSTKAGPMSTTDSPLTIKTRLGQMSLEGSGAQSTFDKYATMPRRRRERSTDQKPTSSHESSTRSSSISRDRVLGSSRMSLSTNTPVRETASANVTPKMRSVVRRITQKIKIFQETSSQTAITNDDLENAFAGRSGTVVDVTVKDTVTVAVQSEIRDKEIEELRKQLRHLTEEKEQLRNVLGGKTILLNSVEQQLVREKEAKLKLQKELQCNSERVIAMLEQHSAGPDSMMDSTDSLMMLETKVTTDSQVVSKQKYELKKMRNVCLALRQELDEALDRERSLIAERESEEMKEFLEIEKSVLTDAAKGEEKAKWQSVVEKKDQEIKWLLEECRHLVRFCEQRRQENMGMQAKYGALEIKSKELLAQQGSAVSGASGALNTLGARLEQLVEQLIASYNISEQELEDVIFHNEAFADSDCSNGNGTPEDEHTPTANRTRSKNGQDLSPQRSHSFINVVINAIRNATSLKKDSEEERPKSLVPRQIERIQEEEQSSRGIFGSKMEDGSDGSTDMLDSETEPCLMMESVLTESRAAVGGLVDATIAEEDDEDNSLDNLSQAISDRQQIEFQTSQMLGTTSNLKSTMLLLKQQSSCDNDASQASSLGEDLPTSLACENCTGGTQAIVEQVISVDNLITKLLKVLRIIQLDNDNCIQHLIGEKNKLQQDKTESEDVMRDSEDVNANLKSQLTTMTQQLLDTEQELNLSKNDLLSCRKEIDKLNHHICELSTLCSNKENNNQTMNPPELLDNSHPPQTAARTRGIERVLKEVLKNIDNVDWNAKKSDSSASSWELAEGELYNNIMSLLKSNGELRAELTEQNRNPNINWQINAISDLKRLYEVIDNALEVLNATPAVIEQYPALRKLQQGLEETNFTLATSLPSYTAILSSMQRDQNSNPTAAASLEEKANEQVIDSMA